MVTLGGLNPFPQPLAAEVLQTLSSDVLAVSEALEAQHGKPTYFPFYLYGGRELRAQQGYLLKFPAELFGVLPDLETARVSAAADDSEPPDEVPEETVRPRTRVARGRVTRVQDPRLRSAIENHAVDQAIDYYRTQGGSHFEKLGKPYDVRLQLNGVERHVEVKGSSLEIQTVELTVNEVTHAAGYQPTDLVVVDGIDWTRTPDGSITTTGGRLRFWQDWTPADADLAPRKYAYLLPEGGTPSGR